MHSESKLPAISEHKVTHNFKYFPKKFPNFQDTNKMQQKCKRFSKTGG